LKRCNITSDIFTTNRHELTRTMRQRKSFCCWCGLWLILVFLLFASCATSPRPGPEQADGSPDFSLLPPDAAVYLWADVKQARPILNVISLNGLSGRDAGRVMDLSDTAMAAVYHEGASRRFFLVGRGKYPSLGAGMAMSFNRGWKKVKSETGHRYWYSKSNNLGAALGPRLAFATDGDPFNAGSLAKPAPPGFEEFRRTCVLSLWLGEPGLTLNNFIGNLGVPLQIPAEDLFIGVVPAQANRWVIVFRIRTPSESQARSLVSLFSMARLLLQRVDGAATGAYQEVAALLFANPPEQENEFLTIRTGPVDELRIALLFSMFSL